MNDERLERLVAHHIIDRISCGSLHNVKVLNLVILDTLEMDKLLIFPSSITKSEAIRSYSKTYGIRLGVY